MARFRGGKEVQTESRTRPRRSIDVALLGILLVGLLLRLPHATDEARYFKAYEDEATYFTTAYAGYLEGPDYPLPHGGSGLPILTEVALDLAGTERGAPVPQPHQDRDYVLTAPQLAAAHIAYGLVLGGNLLFILSTFALSAQLLGRQNPWNLLAPALVAVAPYQVTSNMRFLTEPFYGALVCFAIVLVLQAKARPARLYGAAACLAGAHMLRVNGLFLMLALAVFAFVHLHKPKPRAKREDAPATRRQRLAAYLKAGPWTRLLAYVAVFFLLSAPYLAWRADHLPGAFDYGVNGRYWTDHPWDFKAEYWQTYSMKEGGEKETMADYFDEHSVGHAANRLWQSLWWPFRDTFSTSLQPEPRIVFSVAETLAVAAAVAWGLAKRRLPRLQGQLALMLLLATNLPIVWMYPTVPNPRFFVLLAPIAFVLVAGQLEALGNRRLAQGLAAALLATVLVAFTLRVVHPAPGHVAAWLGMGAWAVTWSLLPVLAWASLRAVRHWQDRHLPPPATPLQSRSTGPGLTPAP